MEIAMNRFSSFRELTRPTLAGVALAIVLAACGGSSGAATPAADATSGESPRPGTAASVAPEGASGADNVLIREGGLCELVPIELAEQALGAPIVSAEAEKSSLGLGHSCRITVDEDTELTLSRSEKQTRDEFEEAFEAVGLTDEVVKGLGEAAYRAPGSALGGPGARLAVFTGERHITVAVYADGDQAAMFDASEAIARTLLDLGL
jgi:hypothetical protein